PQVRLYYPPYTGLSPQSLPDGTGNIDAVAGTVISLHAAADRSLSSAWVEYLPQQREAPLAAFLAPLGTSHPAGVLATSALSAAVWDRVPAHLENDRRTFSLRFRPFLPGAYALYFVDETGLPGHRLYELHLRRDPAPTVQLERPSASYE